MNNVGAAGFPSVSQFASNVHYRAWGGIKNMTYGNGKTLSVGYNARLAPASYQIPSVLNKTYQSFDDGSLKSASDLLDNRYDRAMQYDHVGRLAAAQTGTEARGGSTPDGPFNQTYQYDAFGHTTARTSRQWTTNFTDSGNTYLDERHNGWSYDADGNVINNTDVQFTYDAAGLPTQTVNLLGGSISANSFDGDGRRIKSAFQLNSSSAATTKYYLRATPLGGQVVAEILSTGEKAQGYVYAGNALMAVQKLPVVGDSASYTVWRHAEPSGSVRGTDEGGGQNWAAELVSAERDATGVNMGKEDPGPPQLTTLTDENNPSPLAMGNPARLKGGCQFNNIPIADCGFLMNSSAFDKFNLVAGAVSASNRVVGTRTITTNWHFEWGGSVDDNGGSDTVTVNTNEFSWTSEKTVPIYSSTSFLSVSTLIQQRQPQNPAQQPSPRGFPCPPTVDQVFAGGPAVTAVLDKTWEANRHQDPWTEQGGWIYMNKQGRLKAVAKDRAKQKDPGDGSVSINLWYPPSMRGWILVATFHTHDSDSDPSMPTGEQYSLPNDLWTNEEQGVPGIILGGVLSGNMAFKGYGPKRGYWRNELPKRCR